MRGNLLGDGDGSALNIDGDRILSAFDIHCHVILTSLFNPTYANRVEAEGAYHNEYEDNGEIEFLHDFLQNDQVMATRGLKWKLEFNNKLASPRGCHPRLIREILCAIGAAVTDCRIGGCASKHSLCLIKIRQSTWQGERESEYFLTALAEVLSGLSTCQME